MNKNRTLRERRVFRAKKIKYRKGVAKNKWYLNHLLNRRNGKFADRLAYWIPDIQLVRFSYHDQQKLDALKNRLEDYYESVY